MKVQCPQAPRQAQALIQARVEKLRGEIERVRAADADGIHDMRVASRRLRSALTEHKSVFPKTATAPLFRRARHITKKLGACRELDVCLKLLEDSGLTTTDAARPAREATHQHLSELRSEAASELDDAIQAAASNELQVELDELFNSARPSKRCYLAHASDRLLSAYEQLCRQYKAWRKSERDDDLHQLRIRFKKLRYNCELYVDVYGDDLKKFTKELKKAQDTLGDWNDYRVLRDYKQSIRKDLPPAAHDAMPAFEGELDAHIGKLLSAFERRARAFFDEQKQMRTRALFRWPQTCCCLVTEEPPNKNSASNERKDGKQAEGTSKPAKGG